MDCLTADRLQVSGCSDCRSGLQLPHRCEHGSVPLFTRWPAAHFKLQALSHTRRSVLSDQFLGIDGSFEASFPTQENTVVKTTPQEARSAPVD